MPTRRKKPVRRTQLVMVPQSRGGIPIAPLLATGVGLAKQHKVVSRGSRHLAKQNIPVISDIASVVAPIASALGFGCPPKRRYRRRR